MRNPSTEADEVSRFDFVSSLEVAMLGNSAGRIDGWSRKSGLPVRASSSNEVEEEKIGITVRMDAVGLHSCVAAHVAFGMAWIKAAHDAMSKQKMGVLESICGEMFWRSSVTAV